MMQIGAFSNSNQIRALADAGAAYAELFVTRTVMVGDDREFAAFREEARSWPIPARAFSGLLPRELMVVGPEADSRTQDAYLTRMFSRIAQLVHGEVVATFGSANSRRVPDGFDRSIALDQLDQFLRRAGSIANDHGVRLAFEHLNQGETNFFNTLRECGEFLRERTPPNVFLLADLYHMMVESEPLEVIDEFCDLIVHVHVADTGRDAPGTGDYPFREFFTRLKAGGFSGNCSIEAFWTDFERDVELAVHTCRAAADDAGAFSPEGESR